MPIYLKYLITAGLVVVVSEIAKRSDRVGALVAAMPLVTTLAMIWMWVELDDGTRVEKVASHAWYTFWWVLPTLPMFLLIPWLLRKGVHLGWVMLASFALTGALLYALNWVMGRFGDRLI